MWDLFLGILAIVVIICAIVYITDKNFSINKEKNQKEKKLTNMKLNNEYCKNCKHYFVDDSYHGVFEDRCRLGWDSIEGQIDNSCSIIVGTENCQWTIRDD